MPRASGSAQVPAAGTGQFVGRTQELADLRALLHRHRLMTLTGPAGVGKTRLAIELVPRVRRLYQNRAWWVDLAPLQPGTPVTGAVDTVVGASDEPGHSLAETVQE